MTTPLQYIEEMSGRWAAMEGLPLGPTTKEDEDAYNFALYSMHDITLIGNGNFIYFPAIPKFIIRKKGKRDVYIDIRPFLRRRNIRFIEDIVSDIKDVDRTVIANRETNKNTID